MGLCKDGEENPKIPEKKRVQNWVKIKASNLKIATGISMTCI
jgi:hypothetical protein